MRATDLSEYTGELRASAQVRLTDRDGGFAQTTQDFPLVFNVPCVPTAPTIDKSLCDITTTLDTVIPGAAAEGTRAIWAMDRRSSTAVPTRTPTRPRTLPVCGAGRLRSLGVYPERPCWPPPTPSSDRCT